MRIIVTCGYPTSLHAISLIAELSRIGHEIPLCIEVSLFSKKRILRESRQLGLGKLTEKFKKRVLTKNNSISTNEETRYIYEYTKERSIKFTTVREACKECNARHLVVKSLNSDSAINAARETSPDLIVYAGGGIIHQGFLELPKIGVLNAHGGPLPHFRGMNAAEWSILFGIKPVVTIHFIDRGVDTGPIITREPIGIDLTDTINSVRGKATLVGVKELLRTIETIETGELKTEEQKKTDGVQFFRMSDPLLKIAQAKLEEGNLEEYNPKMQIFDWRKRGV